MTAAHNDDLAGRARGLNTGFIPRPDEYGVEQGRDLEPTQDWDVVATDFVDLARKWAARQLFRIENLVDILQCRVSLDE